MSTACPSNPRKRDRESSPAEQWRNLARTVPATLMHIGTSSSVKAIRSTKNAKSAMKAAKRSGDLSPAGKPDASGSSWPPEAVELLQQARDDVSIGLKALRDTRDAIVVEFFDAWKVLNQNR
uniref:DUF632 domain-containing protein n=1 Tax=Leersia perrieri TaxID=77586 RepID=A0A0D9UWZ2_9ORYZ